MRDAERKVVVGEVCTDSGLRRLRVSCDASYFRYDDMYAEESRIENGHSLELGVGLLGSAELNAHLTLEKSAPRPVLDSSSILLDICLDTFMLNPFLGELRQLWGLSAGPEFDADIQCVEYVFQRPLHRDPRTSADLGEDEKINELILREFWGPCVPRQKSLLNSWHFPTPTFMDCRMQRLLEIYGKEQEQQQEARKMLCRLKHVLADLDAKTASACYGPARCWIYRTGPRPRRRRGIW